MKFFGIKYFKINVLLLKTLKFPLMVVTKMAGLRMSYRECSSSRGVVSVFLRSYKRKEEKMM